MDQTALRDDFKERTSGLGDLLTDGDIDTLLNRFYQYVIPSDVGGAFSETIWELRVMETAYPPVHAFPSWVVAAPNGDVWTESYYTAPVGGGLIGTPPFPLALEDDPARFARIKNWIPGTALPGTVLFHGRTVSFDRVPDKSYVFQIPVRGGSSTGIDTDGIEDDIHALCVVTGAAWMFLLGKEDEAGAAREGGQYEIFKGMLNTRSHSTFKRRRPMRSFK